jgi:hypothetical protein
MPTLRKRAKLMMRKKYKKTIKLSTLDKVWGDWVEYAVIRPLLKYGKVQIDDRTSIEIVGRRIVDSRVASRLLINEMAVSKSGYKMNPMQMPQHRRDYIYKIVFTDKNYKGGQLIFEADKDLRKRVKEELINTFTYYRIENVNK